jgi:hypothetical protein
MLCGVADEPVVVLKSLPVKPGNGAEEKTGMTRTHGKDVRGLPEEPKASAFAKGRSSTESF